MKDAAYVLLWPLFILGLMCLYTPVRLTSGDEAAEDFADRAIRWFEKRFA